MALEKFVIDEENPDYRRGVAWLRLVKVWATLRYDYASWLSPHRVSRVDGELAGTPRRLRRG